jgi:tetratricopeptide (TPR) repeat protein
MNLDLLLSFVQDPHKMANHAVSDLEDMVAEYPYFSAAQLLLLKQYKLQNSSKFNKQLRHAAGVLPDRKQLYRLIEMWPEEVAQVIEAESPTAMVLEQAAAPAVEPVALAAPAELSELTAPLLEQPVQQPLAEVQGVAAADALVATEVAAASDEPVAVLTNSTTATPSEVVSEAIAAPLSTTDAQNASQDSLLVEEWPEPPVLVPAALVAAEAPIVASEAAPEAAMAVEASAPAQVAPTVPEAPAPAPQEASTTVDDSQAALQATADFIAQPHARLSWFKFYAGKPLREQSEEVLDQLYQEHMQQDLLRAPEQDQQIVAIRAQINRAEEVPSSKAVEEEIRRLAYESISDDELPASETLAGIYAAQHDYKKAIRIYQKLILKFPDKMSYFALRIDALRAQS